MDTPHSHFSAVVVSHNTGAVLTSCLLALIGEPLCREIVLVNNGNPRDVDIALSALERDHSKLMIVDGHGNIGFGRGCNLGVEQAHEAHLVFVNPDCVIDSQTLPALAKSLAAYPDALIGGALRNEDGSEQRGCRRGELTPWSALVSFLGLGKAGIEAGIWRDFNRTGEVFPSELIDMPVVSGALIAIRTAQFQAIGGFDPGYFLHVEDIDLCRRVRENGGRVLFDPHATALHIGATSAVSSWSVERAKMLSFSRYFYKNAQTVLDYLGVTLLLPFLVTAIMLRKIVGR